ncbi:unnamed protein product [Danaus chrysippus]|uniref:(African queen) hypothetical protein n=1 Tax=Danaus chrysippus TaxID=151541 RepID=A0A8J2MW37_9NEOP|nr:unnamed protein product [Danaus chrysippus]
MHYKTSAKRRDGLVEGGRCGKYEVREVGDSLSAGCGRAFATVPLSSQYGETAELVLVHVCVAARYVLIDKDDKAVCVCRGPSRDLSPPRLAHPNDT